MNITEIFHSLQGEGPHQGFPTVFVRFTGCDLRCSWCDTAYAFHGGRAMTIEEILAAVMAFRCRRVCLTGGEPLLQKDLPRLAEALVDNGLLVSVETGGHRPLATLPARLTLVVDVKCPGSGEGGRFLEENLRLLKPGDELKFVVADWADLDFALEFCRSRQIPAGVTSRISPAWGALDLPELARRILASGQDVSLALQQHKLIWGAEARGV
ncbi:MAG: radical SAM protein [bacterium]|jgi:7-carboxy-7-deazaguanine synthase|nr:radical SAM protein [bacterium]